VLDWNAAPCGLLALDVDGKVISINRSLLELLGHRAEPPTHVDQMLTHASRIFCQTHFFPLLRLHGQAEEIYLTLKGSDGDVPVLASAHREQELDVIAFLRVQQRSRMEDELMSARKTAEDANRAKERFLATVAHELRTPLNSITGWARMLQSGMLNQNATKQAIETIARNATSQAKLIEDMLDFSRIETGKLRLELLPANLAQVLRAACDVVVPAAEAKGIHFHVSALERETMVLADAERLQQVLWNVLSNAIKFTPKMGNIWVALERINSSVEVNIRDDGAGISPEFLPFVFERFRQAEAGHTRTGGLGLGMAITQDIVLMHGGSLRAESEGAGKGATFILRLPLLSIALAPTPAAQPSGLPKLEGVRLLVVDDQLEARNLLRALLQQQGATVSSAESASEALTRLGQERLDLLISDVEMPGPDGYWLLRNVRSSADPRVRRIPAIALTGNGRLKDRLKALEAGFQVHLPKPVEPLELITTIANLVSAVWTDEKSSS
jgi:signal transduction histidine kinase/ActR/RegA family two-component response regulator